MALERKGTALKRLTPGPHGRRSRAGLPGTATDEKVQHLHGVIAPLGWEARSLSGQKELSHEKSAKLSLLLCGWLGHFPFNH